MVSGKPGWLKRAYDAAPVAFSVVTGVIVAVLFTVSPCWTWRGTDSCAFTWPGQGTLPGGIVYGLLAGLALWGWSRR